jgi:predicted chitinase
LIAILAVGLGACDLTSRERAIERRTPAVDPDSAALSYSHMPMGTSLPAPGAVPIQQKIVKRSAARSPGAKKTARSEPSPYGCYLASRPYTEEVRFRSIYLRFPERIVEAAGEETEPLIFRLDAVRKGRADTTGVRYAHCVVPKAAGAKSIATKQVVRNGEKRAVREALQSVSRHSKAKRDDCGYMKIVRFCDSGGCNIENIVFVDCEPSSGGGGSGGDTGGSSGGSSGGGSDDRCDSYPCEGSGPSGGGEFGDSGDDGQDCEQIVNPLPGSSCAPAEQEVNPCESDNPPEWCEIGCELTTTELETMFPEADSDALTTFKNIVYKFGNKFGVESKSKVKHFMGQMVFESGYEITSAEEANFSRDDILSQEEVRLGEEKRDGDKTYNLERVMKSEKLQFSTVYDDRGQLGNGEPSTYDGWKYRGRGPTQLTGRYNYEQFNEDYSEFAQKQGWNTPDLAKNPEKLTNSARIGTVAALHFWDKEVSGEVDEFTVENVTEAINGGERGLPYRKDQTEKAKEKIDCNN